MNPFRFGEAQYSTLTICIQRQVQLLNARDGESSCFGSFERWAGEVAWREAESSIMVCCKCILRLPFSNHDYSTKPQIELKIIDTKKVNYGFGGKHRMAWLVSSYCGKVGGSTADVAEQRWITQSPQFEYLLTRKTICER